MKLKNQRNEYDKVLEIKYKEELRILENHIGQLTEYSKKTRKIGKQVDQIKEIINLNRLAQRDNYDHRYLQKIIYELSSVDSSFKLDIGKYESNLSVLNRGLTKYSESQTTDYNFSEFKVFVGSITQSGKDSLLIKCIPFDNIIGTELEFYNGDKVVSKSSPFTLSGNPNKLRVEITNPTTCNTERYYYEK